MKSFIELFKFRQKSDIQAGDGTKTGKYPFYTSSSELTKYLDKYIHEGDSLIFGTGGKPSIHFSKTKFAVSTDCLVVQPIDKKNTNAKFYYYYLLGKIYILERGFKGAGLKHISKEYISNIKLPEKDIKYQNKVVEILDKADILRKNRQESIKLLDDFLKATFYDMFGDPVRNDKKWDIKKFSEVGSLDRGISKNRPRNSPDLLGGPYPLIQTGDIANSDGYIKKYTQTYSEKGLKQSKMWPSGTLCITIAANIAKTGILTFDACFPDSVVGFIPNKNVRTEYVQIWLSFLQKMLEDSAPESAQKNINLAILRNLKIPLPPIELQDKFVIINNRLQVFRKSSKQSQIGLDNQFNALMQRYFE